MTTVDDMVSFFKLPELTPEEKGPAMTALGKRQMERFNLSVPAVITPKSIREPEPKMPTEFKTRNVCAGGAFIATDDPLEIGTEVDVDLHLAFFEGNPHHERRSNVHVSGHIIRIEPDGMAVQFNDKYQIHPVI